jgi:hypothetical protein
MNGPSERIVLVDLRIPFFRLVMFFIKASLAAIPAAIVVAIVVWVVTLTVYALFGGSMDFMMQRRAL